MAKYSDDLLDAIWKKGIAIPTKDPAELRKDACGAWIKRNEYNNRYSEFGWEVDHIKLESQGGTDEFDNLRPLQWKNNAARQDEPLVHKVIAFKDHNIDVDMIAKAVADEVIQRIKEECSKD